MAEQKDYSVFVANIPFSVTSKDLYNALEQFGNITVARINT